jgi:glycerol uptake facilitator-like aquaporin
MGDRLAGGNIAIALLANCDSLPAPVLVALIAHLWGISGAHFNPSCEFGRMPRKEGCFGVELPGYLIVQIVGAICGNSGGPSIVFG